MLVFAIAFCNSVYQVSFWGHLPFILGISEYKISHSFMNTSISIAGLTDLACLVLEQSVNLYSNIGTLVQNTIHLMLIQKFYL